MKIKTGLPALAVISSTCLTGVIAALSVATPSLAFTLNYTFNYTGTTVGGPTWQRPIEGNGNPPNALSGYGDIRYSVQQFYVDASGAYDFLSEATNPTGWDNYTFLYANSFNPTAQLTNVIIGNDDYSTGAGESGFSGVSLTAGTAYFFVTTGYNNSNSGAFSNTISGPGNISTSQPVPEPLTILGTGVVLGAIPVLKKEYAKRKKNKDEDA